MSMEPFENSANFQEDVGLFEAATHSTVIELPKPVLKVITVVLDGSDQDGTARGFAEALAKRTGASVEVLSELTSTSEILAEMAKRHSNLLILPVPFGQNYGELKSESLGSVADQLLLKSSCPVLCVREIQDDASIQAALDHVLVPIAIADNLVPRALGWAFHVTPVDGRLDLIAVADRDVLAEASLLMPETTDVALMDQDHLLRSLVREIGSLVATAQKAGTADHRAIHVETRVGAFVPLVLEELHGHPHLIVWSITREHSSPAFHRAVDLLLSSTSPILMV